MASLEFFRKFSTEEACFTYLMKKRWPEGVHCPRCGGNSVRIAPCKKLFVCRKTGGCQYNFRLTTATALHYTFNPLMNWLYAMYYFSSKRQRISAAQLAKNLGMSPKAAARMFDTLRKVVSHHCHSDRKLSGVVEIDEMFFSGARKRPGRPDGKIALGLKERGGEVRVFAVPNRTTATIQAILDANICKGSQIMTDGFTAYRGIQGFDHQWVYHNNMEFVRDDVHTNNIEGFWGRMKRAIRGTHISIRPGKHQLFVSEFVWRENTSHLTDQERFEQLVSLVLSHVPTEQDRDFTRRSDCERMRRVYLRDPEKKRAYRREYYRKNRDREKQRSLERYHANKIVELTPLAKAG